MRTSLDHLPQVQQQELAYIIRTLFDEFEAAHAMGTSKWKKQARIFKMILYGRYARGGADDDPGCKSDYRSEEHTSELQSLMRISYAVFCLKKKNKKTQYKSEKNTTKLHVNNKTRNI